MAIVEEGQPGRAGAVRGFWSAQRLDAPVALDFQPAGAMFPPVKASCKRVGACELLAVDCGPGVLRGADEDKGRLCLVVPQSGRAVPVAGDDAVALGEGDLLLEETGRGLHLRLTEPTRLILICVPGRIASERLPWLSRIAGATVSGRDGPGALFSRFVRDAWTGLQRFDGAWSTSLDQVLWPMIEMVFAAHRDEIIDVSRKEARRRTLFDYIEANLCEPELDTQAIAASVGMSPRYVQMLFSELEVTPSAFIRSRRLDLAAQRLAGGGPGTSITEVAYEVGFNDLSSFCRAFRQRYQVAPRDYRAGHRHAVAA